ncbi:hypothetical protein DJICPGNB_25925 [Escherichia coli]|nr:hypothetical protein DJICPGNB_25925 [Escherichia coli]
MSYSTFRLGANDATKEPMFLGQSVNVARYDQQKYRDFEKLIERQLSFFWRPEKLPIFRRNHNDFNGLRRIQACIFCDNLRYQRCSDSVQGRSPILPRCCRYPLFWAEAVVSRRRYLNAIWRQLHHIHYCSVMDDRY